MSSTVELGVFTARSALPLFKDEAFLSALVLLLSCRPWKHHFGLCYVIKFASSFVTACSAKFWLCYIPNIARAIGGEIFGTVLALFR